jgi:hypothetical protein
MPLERVVVGEFVEASNRFAQRHEQILPLSPCT